METNVYHIAIIDQGHYGILRCGQDHDCFFYLVFWSDQVILAMDNGD